jgi:hypothetical protein
MAQSPLQATIEPGGSRERWVLILDRERQPVGASACRTGLRSHARMHYSEPALGADQIE